MAEDESAIGVSSKGGDLDVAKYLEIENEDPPIDKLGVRGKQYSSSIRQDEAARLTRKAFKKKAVNFIKGPFGNRWSMKEVDELLANFGLLFLLGLTLLSAVFFFGFDFMWLGGAGFSIWLVWFCSISTGTLCKQYKIPALLGNLMCGIVLRNLPGGPLDALPSSWTALVRSTGLSLILMRSGLELDVPMVMQQGFIAARLTLCPGIVEAMVCGGVASGIWGMPIALGMSLGFILAAVSPAVVVSGMFDLQKRGYGIAKGIPSLVVAAASFDDVVAISGYSICIGIAISTGHDSTMSALEGPINIIAGILVGIIGGVICSFTKLFNTDTKRTIVTMFMGFFLMYLATFLHFHGAGALAGLVTTITASYCWQNASLQDTWPLTYFKGLAVPEPNFDWHHDTEHEFALAWDYIMSPLLFGCIGASIDFSVLDMSVIPNSLLVVFCGMCVRVPTAFFVTSGKDLTAIERLFIGLAWIPKATVQAALGSVPLDLIEHAYSTDDPQYEEYHAYGQQILVTAVVAILLTAPIGLICINLFGDKWLTNDLEAIAMAKQQAKDEAAGIVKTEPSAHQPKKRTGSFGEGPININHSDSFLQGVTDFFSTITGGSDHIEHVADDKMDLDQKLDLHSVHLPKYNWERSMERQRMTPEVRGELNKRLAVHFFHNLTNHVEHLETKLGPVTADVQDDIAVIMEGIMACYKVVQDQGADFPVQQLFSLMHDDHKLTTTGEKATFDSVQGKVIVDDNDDPLMESMEALERRDQIIAKKRPSTTNAISGMGGERRLSGSSDTGLGNV